MAGRGPQSFKKRQKEQERKERQQAKIERKIQRKLNPTPAGEDELDVDSVKSEEVQEAQRQEG